MEQDLQKDGRQRKIRDHPVLASEVLTVHDRYIHQECDRTAEISIQFLRRDE